MCDIDGTLLNSKGIVTSKTIDAIKKVREQGILFGISTGRAVSYTHLQKYGVSQDIGIS